MNDLIRRRDAVSRMSDLLMMELQGQRLPTWNEVYQAMNDIPSAEPERRWIPVTEALPEEETDVLVTVHFDGHKNPNVDLPPSDYVEIASHVDGVWSSLSDEYKVAWKKHHVVAWMPTPEPYRGE